ncbi:MAG: dihydrolipoyl dehydrogenase [Candidatus Bathyarchaeota archaeon]|nr:MAG: dihydrolipoyl dehydrogenase [Candidatus Bathyarchaeota archaeon]
MKEYELIAIGTGSAMNIVGAVVQRNPEMKVAVIDKDEPGGICLTRGCIPSKMLLYPAELIRTIANTEKFGIDVQVKEVDFQRVMERMRKAIQKDIDTIRQGLSNSENIDYYPAPAEFVGPYKLRVSDQTITSKMILLCTGSKPTVPPIKGLEDVGYLTSDTFLQMTRLPKRIAVIGGGYIAAEYGHFLSAMGSIVTIIGRNPQFLKQEEPEISALAKRELEKYMTILTNHEVKEVRKTSTGKKLLTINRADGAQIAIDTEEILVATGRSSHTDLLHPEKAGIDTDRNGWIIVDEYMESSQPNIWAFGDANGKHLFKHAANYESQIVYYNAVLKKRVKADYHAIPHAVFTYPEIGAVGLREREAIERFGADNVLIGFYRYENTAKGEAMAVRDYFVKVIVKRDDLKILGAHIIGPHASVLIQEVVNLMYTTTQNITPITRGMHIHPALTEVVERAFRSLMEPAHYHHVQEGHTHS